MKTVVGHFFWKAVFVLC